MALSILCKSLLIASEGGIACVGVNLTLMRTTSLHLQHDLTRTTCYQACYPPRGLSEVVHFMILLPKRIAWIRPVNVDYRWIIIALHFSRCGTIKFLSHHSWSSTRTLFSVFVSKFIVSSIQYIVVSSAYR